MSSTYTVPVSAARVTRAQLEAEIEKHRTFMADLADDMERNGYSGYARLLRVHLQRARIGPVNVPMCCACAGSGDAPKGER